MIKRLLLVSSLMVSIPLWAASPDAEPSAAGQTPSASQTAQSAAGGKAASQDKASASQSTAPAKSTDAKAKAKEEAKEEARPSAACQELLDERQKHQRMVFHLMAKRDSELNRLALGRLAASRGGDPDYNDTKDKQMIQQMRDLKADYDRQLAKEQADLDAVDERLAKLTAKEKASPKKGQAECPYNPPPKKAAESGDEKSGADTKTSADAKSATDAKPGTATR